MPTSKEIRSQLRPFIGMLSASNYADCLSKAMDDDEVVEMAGPGKLGKFIALTSHKLVFLEGSFKLKAIPYDRDKIENFRTERTEKKDYIRFDYEGKDTVYPIERLKKNSEFAAKLEKALGNPGNNVRGVKEWANLKGKISVGLNIINGANQLGFKATYGYTMYQEQPGEVKFTADTNLPIDGTFKLIGYDRTENFKQSMSNIIGAATIGRIYGTAGAITGALAAIGTGKDLSTASILLQRENGEKFIIITKCDKNTLHDLQKFIPDALEEKHAEPFLSPADEIKKYKELLDMGAITEEEFSAKKRELLKL